MNSRLFSWPMKLFQNTGCSSGKDFLEGEFVCGGSKFFSLGEAPIEMGDLFFSINYFPTEVLPFTMICLNTF